jgi:hypothetical protein
MILYFIRDSHKRKSCLKRAAFSFVIIVVLIFRSRRKTGGWGTG